MNNNNMNNINESVVIQDLGFDECENLTSLKTNFANFDACGSTLLDMKDENDFDFINV